MAEKSDKKSEPAPAPPAAPAEKKEPSGEKKGAGGGLGKTPLLLGIVMLVEAAVLFAGFKLLGGGPQHSVAIQLSAGEKGGHGDKPAGDGAPGAAGGERTVEVPVVELRAPNSQNGRRFIYEVAFVALVKADAEAKVKDAIKAHENQIKDRVRTIVAQMDPEKLGGGSEPGLETLRRQTRKQLDIIIGDNMIDEVVVPKCNPFRADF